ncbi:MULTISPECIES: cytochrome ubiquinol oxidase subunit I [unclassified Bradyrhizobium]|uniref:cytochrome ubiquinol oxidase subunit I n=1 Tax=unclassified Bradyrhizobium TaxID=2631580 RepID=UPI00247860D2|nr:MULTISPECIES: cytochrome ubiquinol oxidase subunit I [unclassified Bradyrhizobium]WGR73191.1 cytochrome ubiquinol oxidase subunit I [Bradyrhizobium sp. ISRA426]WGR78030.1 cytochrome ubiquinol oxidase subunit I [Bradyrhizobium sp. ISRA430]WGR88431.1 cytochrome ubiquinol oxidase subunit I [Bradyrhizobium sp. ISRA432]
MEADPLLLSRIQFGLTVTFHIIFPTMSIGLAMFLTVIEFLWLRTSDELYLRIYRFWLVIFAMGFGVGVVTGIVLSFEFGTNFATFAKLAGPVIGPLIGLEVLSAFFLEAGFLGIMLFGMGRVGPKLHFAATFLVALGTTISASWILAANSWMQTPAGVAIHDGRFVVTDWLQVIFNPSYLYRLPHMLLAAYISASFLVAGVGAWYLMKSRHLDFARRTFSIGMGLVSTFIAAQLFMGDTVAARMIPLQPSKFQAMEGYWDSTPSAAYLVFVAPDQKAQTNHIQIGIPYLGSLFVTRSLHGTVPGLKETSPADQPPMAAVFYAFRTMFLLGLLMFGAACISIWLRWQDRLFTSRWFHKFIIVMSPAGFVATVAGWYTAEIGRQPWVIFGQLRTADAVSPVAASSVFTTTLLFGVVYAIFSAAFLTLTLRLIARGPIDGPRTSPYSGGSPKRAIMAPLPAPAAMQEGQLQ